MPSIISADLAITGDLVCAGDIQVDGTVTGDIRSRSVVIGEGAVVTGNLRAETVRICGRLVGEVTAAQVILEKTAQVTGDILHSSLSIIEGAFLQGACKRLDAGTDMAVPPRSVMPAANEDDPARKADALPAAG